MSWGKALHQAQEHQASQAAEAFGSASSNIQTARSRLATAQGEIRRLERLLEEARPSLTTDEIEALEHTLGMISLYVNESRNLL